MTLSEILGKGFAAALRRPGLIFLDILWKALWLGANLAGLLLLLAWFSSQLQSITWQDTAVPALNGLLAARLLQEFWEARGGELLWGLGLVLAASVAAWFLLEAFFRRRMLRWANSPPKSGGEFGVFLLSGLLKATILLTTAFILALICFASYLSTPFPDWPTLWPETRAVALAATVALLATAFLLAIFETLIRGDAVVLLGTDLIRLTGVVGILMLFETMIGASVVIAVIAGFLNVSQMAEAMAMIGVAALAALFLCLVHSYLLLVRFSAIDIMSGCECKPDRAQPVSK